MYYYKFFFFYMYNIDYIIIQVVHIWCFLFMSFFYKHFPPIFQLGLFRKFFVMIIALFEVVTLSLADYVTDQVTAQSIDNETPLQ